MIVQASADEQKLNSMKQSVRRRPIDVSTSRSKSELPTEILFSNMLAGTSSDDVDSLFDQATNYTERTSSPSITMNDNDKHRHGGSSTPSTHSLSTVQNRTNQVDDNNINRPSVDCASVTSSECGVESEISGPNLQQYNALIERTSKSLQKNKLDFSM